MKEQVGSFPVTEHRVPQSIERKTKPKENDTAIRLNGSQKLE